MAEKVDWSRRFDAPIKTPDGKMLRTLKDAADYVLALPPEMQAELAWQRAAECLKLAAEREIAWMWFARSAMMHALLGLDERQPPPTKAERFKAKRVAAKKGIHRSGDK